MAKGLTGDMSVFEPESHFSELRKGKVDVRTRKMDDRGNDVVKETGHHGVANMPKRPSNKRKQVTRSPGFERGPKTRF